MLILSLLHSWTVILLFAADIPQKFYNKKWRKRQLVVFSLLHPNEEKHLCVYHFKIYFYLFICACVSAHTCMHKHVPEEARRGPWAPLRSCASRWLCRCWEPNSGPLGEQEVFLNTGSQASPQATNTLNNQKGQCEEGKEDFFLKKYHLFLRL